MYNRALKAYGTHEGNESTNINLCLQKYFAVLETHYGTTSQTKLLIKFHIMLLFFFRTVSRRDKQVPILRLDTNSS